MVSAGSAAGNLGCVASVADIRSAERRSLEFAARFLAADKIKQARRGAEDSPKIGIGAGQIKDSITLPKQFNKLCKKRANGENERSSPCCVVSV